MIMSVWSLGTRFSVQWLALVNTVEPLGFIRGGKFLDELSD
jgi:hypothetical protein